MTLACLLGAPGPVRASAQTTKDDAPNAVLCGLEFARASATIDINGDPVAPNEPRFGAPQDVPVLFTPWEVLAPVHLVNASILGAGRDVTGAEALFVLKGWKSRSTLALWSYGAPGSTPEELFVSESHLVGFDLDEFGITGSEYAADTGDTQTKRLSSIRDAMVYQGTVYVYFSQQHLVAGQWVDCGFVLLRGVFDTVTRAVTWQIAFDDLDYFGAVSAQGPNSEPGALTATRGADWSMSGIWTPYARGQLSTLVAHACAVDYITRGSGAPSDGRVFVERLTRTNVGDAWVPSGALVFQWSDIVDPVGGFIDHIHASVLLEWIDPATGRKGLQLILSAGDVGYKNRNVRLTWVGDTDYDPSDPGALAAEQSWRDIANWTVTDNYHGDGCGGTNGDLQPPFGLNSNQWVAACQGIQEGKFLVGDDVCSAVVHELDATDWDAEHPAFRAMTPAVARDGVVNAIVVRTADPADGASLWFVQHSTSSNWSPPLDPDREYYTPDWGQSWLLAPRGSQGVVGDRLYRINNGNTLEVCDVPATHRVRPLQVAPGRTNLAADYANGYGLLVGSSQGVAVTRIARHTDGHFYDGTPGDPAARLPDPPSMTDTITKHVGDRYYVDSPGTGQMSNWDYLHYIRMRGSLPGLLNTTGVERRALARIHLLASRASGPAGALFFNWGGYADSMIFSNLDAYASAAWETFGAITPPTAEMSDDSDEPLLRVTIGPNDVFYLAVDNLHFEDTPAGRSLEVGYPAPPMGTLGADLPDESAIIGGLALAHADGTLCLFGAVPGDDWHELTGRHAFARLTGPTGELVSFAFDSNTTTLIARVERPGGAAQEIEIASPSPDNNHAAFPYRGGPVTIALSVLEDRLLIAANLMGDPCAAELAIPDYDTAPFGTLDTLTLATDDEGRVSAFDYFGYRRDDFVDNTTDQLALLRDATGVGLGDDCNTCPPDINGDGSLNLDDINLFAVGFVGGDLSVDMDGNGVLNLDDINLFAAAFLAGCP